MNWTMQAYKDNRIRAVITVDNITEGRHIAKIISSMYDKLDLYNTKNEFVKSYK